MGILIFCWATLQLVQNIKPIRILFCTTGSCSDLGIYLIYNICKFHQTLRTLLDSLPFTSLPSLTHSPHSLTSRPDSKGSTCTEGWPDSSRPSVLHPSSPPTKEGGCALPPLPMKIEGGLCTERARLVTLSFVAERARLGHFSGFGTERARLGPLEA